MLGLRFIAVVPRSVAAAKIELIRFQGGEIHYVDNPADAYEEAAPRPGDRWPLHGPVYLAERATDWRGNNNIAESIFGQLRRSPSRIPQWIVCGAGTGGTSATIGRYIRYERLPTRLCVADPEASIFHRHYADRTITDLPGGTPPSCIEGIGRQRVEPSFIPEIVDRMMAVTDARASLRCA